MFVGISSFNMVQSTWAFLTPFNQLSGTLGALGLTLPPIIFNLLNLFNPWIKRVQKSFQESITLPHFDFLHVCTYQVINKWVDIYRSSMHIYSAKLQDYTNLNESKNFDVTTSQGATVMSKISRFIGIANDRIFSTYIMINSQPDSTISTLTNSVEPTIEVFEMLDVTCLTH